MIEVVEAHFAHVDIVVGSAGGSRSSGGDASTPQDVAELVAFLCSERAGYISGAVVPVVGRRDV